MQITLIIVEYMQQSNRKMIASCTLMENFQSQQHNTLYHKRMNEALANLGQDYLWGDRKTAKTLSVKVWKRSENDATINTTATTSTTTTIATTITLL